MGVDGEPLLRGHVLPADALRSALDSLAASLLHDMLDFEASATEASVAWAAQSKVAFTEALDAALRRHRPRSGQNEEGRRRERSVQLQGQKRQVAALVAAQTAAVNSQV